MKRRTLAAVVWTAVMVAALFWPAAGMPDSGGSSLDKLAHAILFLVFTVLWLGKDSRCKRVLGVVAAGLLFAAWTEWMQGLLPGGRTPEWLDLGADAAGLLAGWFAVWLLRLWRTTLDNDQKRFRASNFRICD